MPHSNAMSLFVLLSLAACGRNPVDLDEPDSGSSESTTGYAEGSSSEVGSTSPGWPSSTTNDEMGSSSGGDGIGSTTSGSTGEGSSGEALDESTGGGGCLGYHMEVIRCVCDDTLRPVDPALCGCYLGETLPGVTECLCDDGSEYPVESCGWPCVNDDDSGCHCGDFPAPQQWCYTVDCSVIVGPCGTCYNDPVGWCTCANGSWPGECP